MLRDVVLRGAVLAVLAVLAEDWRLGASYVDGWGESQDTRMDGYGWDALRVSRLSFLVWRRHNPVIRRGRWLGIRLLGRVYGCPALARRRCCVHRRLVYRRLVASCRGASGVVWRVTSQAMRLSHSMRCSVRLHPSRLHLHLHLHLLRFVGVFHISGARTDFFSRRGTDDVEPATRRKNSATRTALLPFPRD